MDERNDVDKVDEVMLPGFRFHPTDEELVGFYLKRKIQQKPLSIELIKQLDIYKFDPWDLPKLATTGEKEWYFYCPRDRKYRNSARPNRVTGAGFWKATGTDRPIYSSEGAKCIGLKKSLVFYRGRAAKGIKTDWMMHEFRLPSVPDSTLNRRPTDKSFPANDSWAICRIFKKTNSMAQRALSQSWVSPMPENTCSDILAHAGHMIQFSENNSCTTEAGSAIQFSCNNDLQQPPANFSPLNIPSYRPINPTLHKPASISISNMEFPAGFMFSPLEMLMPEKSNTDVASMLPNLPPVLFGDVGKDPAGTYFGSQQQYNGLSMNSPQEMHENMNIIEDDTSISKNTDVSHMNNQWGPVRSFNFPFNLPPHLTDTWKTNSPWDSPPSPSEMSTSYSTNKCYT